MSLPSIENDVKMINIKIFISDFVNKNVLDSNTKILKLKQVNKNITMNNSVEPKFMLECIMNLLT